MASYVTLVGLVAAFCTTVSYIPQLKKCGATGSIDDISLRMFLIVAAGIALWVVYGVPARRRHHSGRCGEPDSALRHSVLQTL